jgi:hypothetical protein
MKKIFKTMLFVSLVSILFSSLLVFAGEPGALENDLKQLMDGIVLAPNQRNFKYENVYNNLIKKYKENDLLPIKTIHLKYLFLKGNKDEFLKTLKSFSDDYIFKTYLDVNGKQVEFAESLKSKKEFTKKDLLLLWDKISEIDKEIDNKIQKKDFAYFLDCMKLNEFLGPYSIFEENEQYLWAKGIQTFGEDNAIYLGYQTVEHKFLINKFLKAANFINKNYASIVNRDDLLLKLLVLPESRSMNDLRIFKSFKKGLYSKDDLKQIETAVIAFQKESFSLDKVLILPAANSNDGFIEKQMKYYDKDANESETVFNNPYFYAFKEKKINNIESDITLYSINKNMFALDVTGDSRNQRLLIFSKDKEGVYQPYIFYLRWPLSN